MDETMANNSLVLSRRRRSKRNLARQHWTQFGTTPLGGSWSASAAAANRMRPSIAAWLQRCRHSHCRRHSRSCADFFFSSKMLPNQLVLSPMYVHHEYGIGIQCSSTESNFRILNSLDNNKIIPLLQKIFYQIFDAAISLRHWLDHDSVSGLYHQFINS